MKRSDNARDLVVRRWGVKSLGTEWTEGCIAELRRGNDLWNALIERHRKAQAAREALEDTIPGVAEARAALRGAEATDEEDDKEATKVAREELRAALKAARALPHIKAELKAIESARRRATDEVRQQAVLAGLYWATATAIADGFETARRNMLDKRAKGEQTDLHFRSFDGSGRLVNQLTGGGMPLATFIERVMSIDKPGGRALPPAAAPQGSASKRGRTNATHFSMVAYTSNKAEPRTIERWRKPKGAAEAKCETVLWRPPGEPHRVDLVVNRHRDFAGEDVRIKSVALVLTANRDWTRFNKPEDKYLSRDTRVVVTATAAGGSTLIDEPGREIVAVNLGWRIVDEGLRIATIVGQREDLPRLRERPIIGAAQDPRYFRVLPRAWGIDLADEEKGLRGERDAALNAMLPRLRGIRWSEAPTPLGEFGATLAKAPKIGQRSLTRLTVDWLLDHSQWQPDDLAAFEAWRRADNRLQKQQQARMRRFTGRRDEWYRLLAKEIAERATVVLVSSADYAKLARKTDIQAVSRNRFLAAAGGLLREIRRAMRARGKDVIEMPGPTTWEWCPVGNHPLAVPVPLCMDLHYFCGQCRAMLDIDTSHCATLLMRHTGVLKTAA